MFSDYNIRLVNNHIIIDDDQNIIVDTGSPVSFHHSRVLNLCGEQISVRDSIPDVSKEYLSEKVGTQIDGLLGMDIIRQHPLLVSLKDGFIILDDDVPYNHSFCHIDNNHFSDMMIIIRMLVNGHPAKVIVDTGAPLSYIQRTFTEDLKCDCIRDDFSPYIGNYKTETFLCEVDTKIDDKPYIQRFGTPPALLEMTLQQLNVDGVIGVDLFKQYRIQIRGTKMFLPPQGI